MCEAQPPHVVEYVELLFDLLDAHPYDATPSVHATCQDTNDALKDEHKAVTAISSESDSVLMRAFSLFS